VLLGLSKVGQSGEKILTALWGCCFGRFGHDMRLPSKRKQMIFCFYDDVKSNQDDGLMSRVLSSFVEVCI
jgi:hypothetical protein